MIEMTSHSHTHVSYAANTLAFQMSDLKDGNDEMELVTGGRLGCTSVYVSVHTVSEDDDMTSSSYILTCLTHHRSTQSMTY